MWHKDFDRNVVLTPDLVSYESTLPGDAFVLAREIAPGGWVIDGTYFQYKRGDFDTNFGIGNYVGQRNFPQPYFNSILTRRFIDGFIVT